MKHIAESIRDRRGFFMTPILQNHDIVILHDGRPYMVLTDPDEIERSGFDSIDRASEDGILFCWDDGPCICYLSFYNNKTMNFGNGNKPDLDIDVVYRNEQSAQKKIQKVIDTCKTSNLTHMYLENEYRLIWKRN